MGSPEDYKIVFLDWKNLSDILVDFVLCSWKRVSYSTSAVWSQLGSGLDGNQMRFILHISNGNEVMLVAFF